MDFKYGGIDSADVVFMLGGKEIGKMQTVGAVEYEAENERKIKNGDNLTLFNHEYTINVEDVQIDPDFITKLKPNKQSFKVVGTVYKYPRGNKLPNKKRIRNKWIKKYQREITFGNCMIG